MLFGAILASHKDAHATFVGVFWMFCNCVFTAGYVLYMKHATQSVKVRWGVLMRVERILLSHHPA